VALQIKTFGSALAISSAILPMFFGKLEFPMLLYDSGAALA
jgi:hypothetical protein